MKAILLAAGRGTRISRMIKEIPKCVLPVDGVPLIRRSVMMLLEKIFSQLYAWVTVKKKFMKH
ncbi:hypothetical protein PAV_1c08430 [Paenibacillus alvei DSM 29]|uniref:NTP transferase domain-containing protein n=1 Tax=Paenibacillus alvei TaxID=44250 RepID=UPI00028A1BF5|nr:NTP transferase domain-containing protein [Paenibacillus alvei]EJW19855.1 hypothetical protein PAV_1c08430 [Paenibacillus alvei DSM 29]